MLLLVLCVIINAFVGVIFKYFQKYDVNVFQAIVVNYFVCGITGAVVYGGNPFSAAMVTETWFPYALVLSATFIGTFVLMALTVQGFGLVVASIFQKMSLLAPTILGILVYSESAGIVKVLGIVVAIVSIFLITKSDTNTALPSKHTRWIYPIVVFLGSCLIDTILYYVNVKHIVDSGDIRFVITLFSVAGVIGLAVLVFQLSTKKSVFESKSIIAGIALGIPNFFSIYLLLLVLSNGMDGSVVFPINNVGILTFSAIFGLLFFHEKIGPFKAGGLILAITAIVLIAYG